MKKTARSMRTMRGAMTSCVLALAALAPASPRRSLAEPERRPGGCVLRPGRQRLFETYYETIGLGWPATTPTRPASTSGCRPRSRSTTTGAGTSFGPGTVVTPGVGLPTTHCIWSADFQSGGATYHVEADGYLLITPVG